MRTEIEMENGRKREEHIRIDLQGLCGECNLNWFSYQECGNCKEVLVNCQCKKEKRAPRTVYFIHENGLTTGAKYLRKQEMAENVLAFSIHRLVPRNRHNSFIAWAGVRGARILTTMSEEARNEVRRAKAALEAMKEASAAGEVVAVTEVAS